MDKEPTEGEVPLSTGANWKLRLVDLLRKLNFRRNFLTGLIFLVPVVITFYVFYLVVIKMGGSLGKVLGVFPILSSLPKSILTFISVILTILGTYAIGVFAGSIVGRRFLSTGDAILSRVPFLKGIYLASKELTQAVVGEKKAFRKAVLIPFPRPGSYAIGFLTSDRKWKVGDKVYLNVFVPTTPNPTSGWYLIVPEEEVTYLNISTEEGIKLVVSGGVVFSKGTGKEIEDAIESKAPKIHQ
jgi:uncharacterized membrane protein